MICQKNKMEQLAKEIFRCETILSNPSSSKEEIDCAEWKITSIMQVYSKDPETLFTFMGILEKITVESLYNL